MIRWLFTVLVGGLFFTPLYAKSIDVAPDTMVRKVTEDTMAIVRSDDTRTGDRRKLIDLVEAEVLPCFSFDRMTRLAMGNEWGQASPQQHQILVNEFRTLLVNTYASAFANYKDQTVTVEPLRMDSGDSDVVVKTLVSQHNGEAPIAIDYYMEKTGNGWKAYDFSVDDVRWVLNYRNTFIDIVQNNGVNGLIKALQDKNDH